jgi:hypothetical protein
MHSALKRELPETEETPTRESGVIVRTSFITQMHRASRVDNAVLDTLQVLAHTVADFAALPDLQIISTGNRNALVLVTAVWPEKLAVKMTGLATAVPHEDNASMLIISAKITTETAPVARALADALIGTLPVSVVSRITAITPPLVPLPAVSDATIGAEHLMQPLCFDPSRGVPLRMSAKRIGWSVVR